MIRGRLIIALVLFSLAPIVSAETHNDRATGYSIKFPDKWEVDQAEPATIATAPDRLASILVISIKGTDEAADALQRLDIDDVMGSQIKSIRPAEKVVSKTINGLPAKLFSGTANIANVKVPFVAAVIQEKKSPAFVVFAFPANNAHVERIVASINSIRGPGSGK